MLIVFLILIVAFILTLIWMRENIICEELMKYNEEHGTSYSYGEYTALVGMGKIKSKYRNERDIDLLLL